jgi:hypothetical protein
MLALRAGLVSLAHAKGVMWVRRSIMSIVEKYGYASEKCKKVEYVL